MYWTKKECNTEISDAISKYFNLSKTLSEILCNRNLDTPEKVFYFLHGEFENSFSPFVFEQMEQTVAYLRTLIDEDRPLYIVGDKDVDGLTGTAIFYSFFKKMGLSKVYYNLPVQKESYGFSERIFKNILEKNVDTVLTVDCGIKENLFIDKLNKKGVHTIITDHHSLPKQLPDAYSIINPHREDKLNIPDISGALVAFKLIQAVYFSYHPFYNKTFFCFHIGKEIKGFLFKNFIPLEEKFEFSNLEELKNFLKDKKDLMIVSDLDSLNKMQNFFKSYNSNIFDVIHLGLESIENTNTLKKNDLFSITKEHRIFYDVLNPQRSIFSLFKKLFFKFYLKLDEKLDNFLQLATLGTVCDYMPLNHIENRILVKKGLELLNKELPNFIQLILKDKHLLDMKDIGFLIGPLLNSGGRLGESHVSFQFIIEPSDEKRASIYNRLKTLNQRRKKMGTDAYKDALNQIELYQKDQEVLFYDSSDITQGLTGIIATKISQFYRKPSFAFFIDEEIEQVIGSGRSFQDLDLLNIVTNCQISFTRFGGHKKACGMTFPLNELNLMKDQLLEISHEYLKNNSLEDIFYYDVEMNPKDITFELVYKIQELSPFGPENEEPIFLLRKLSPINCFKIGKKQNHLKFKVKENPSIDFIAWNMAEKEELVKHSKIDLLFHLEENIYNNHAYIQGHILNIRESAV